MHRLTPIITILLTAMTIVACATLHPDYETPTVNVKAIRPLPSEHLAPQFEIVLHIVNPNRTPLNLHGVACTLSLDGHDLLTGVASDLPTIAGYGDGDITLTATSSLLSGIRFFADLMQNQRERIAYELTAKLDPGGLRPTIRISEKGEIDLSGQLR
jgi:LEA14-like dessication related protein